MAFADDDSGSGIVPTRESRAEARTKVSWRLRLMEPGQPFYEGRACDITESGVGVLCDKTFAVGSVVDLALAIPTHAATAMEVKTCRAKVIFASFSGGQCRLGMQFQAASDELRLSIRQAIKPPG